MVCGAWSVPMQRMRPVGERGAQGIAVGCRLDRRVALDACAESFVVGLGEEQMRQTGLGRDERIVGSEEFELTSRREVRHMQARLGGFGQFDGVFRALQAGSAERILA